MLLENNLPYKLHSKVNTDSIRDALNSLDPKLWNVFTKRQSDLPHTPHKETTSLLYQYCPGEPELDNKVKKLPPAYRSGKFPVPNEFVRNSTESNFKEFLQEIEEKFIDEQLNNATKTVVKKLEKTFNGISGLVVFAKLPPSKVITPHSDPGFYLSIVHRLHIPIFTNEHCYFCLDNHKIHMEEGFLYEINNLMVHSVENNGNTDRIHLIVDIIPNSVIEKINFEKVV